MALVCPNRASERFGSVLPTTISSRLGLCMHNVNNSAAVHRAREFCMAENSLTAAASSLNNCSSASSGHTRQDSSERGAKQLTAASLEISSDIQSGPGGGSGLLLATVPNLGIGAAVVGKAPGKLASPTPAGWSTYNSSSSVSTFPASSGREDWSMFLPPAAHIPPVLGGPLAMTSSHLFSSPLSVPSQTGTSTAFSNSREQAAAFSIRNEFHLQSLSAAQPIGMGGSMSGASCNAASSLGKLMEEGSSEQQQQFLGVAAGSNLLQHELPHVGFSEAGGQRRDKASLPPSDHHDILQQNVMDHEDTISVWVDGTITELMAAMPGVPLQHLFAKLIEVLEPCNMQLQKLIESRFHALFGSTTEEAPGWQLQRLSHAHGSPSSASQAGGHGGSSKRMRGNTNNEEDDLLNVRVNEFRSNSGGGEVLLHLQGKRHEQHPSSLLPQLPPPMTRDSEAFTTAIEDRSIASLQLSLDPWNQRMQEHSQQQQQQQQVSAVVKDQFHHLRALEMNLLPVQQQQQQQQQQYHQPLPQQQQQQHRHHHEEQARTAQNYSSTTLHPSAAEVAHYGNQASSSVYENTQGLELLALLLQCAEAVSANNVNDANSMLLQLSELATPYGSSVQRVVAYFAEGMASRLVASSLGFLSPLPPIQMITTQKIVSAVQIFNDMCPLVKFSHFTANQAIVDAFEGMRDVHIIDIDIMHGLQWPALFHILACRPGGPPQVRITGLGTSMELLEATGKRLSDFAETLRLPFEYNAVVDRIGNVDPSALRVRMGDALAVHWMQHSLYDVTGSDPQFLSLLRRLSPKVITMVEQNLRHEGSFIDRFIEALHYYSALFDSLGANYTDENLDRHLVEQQLLSCEIKNIIAVGGPARTGQPKFVQWREELTQAGFKPVSLSGKAATQASLLLGMFPCDGYTLIDQTGTLKLGWKDHCLLTASAWSSNAHS
ncbi:hypothetical protein CY35_18G012800 [Sphagnum magellanicum]|nr:hypothetical protein CY35_18G012800 [Sphagnum magellanicum]